MKWFTIISIWFIFFILLLVNVVSLSNFWINGPTLIGWLLLALQFTVNKSEKLYLFLRRIQFYFRNYDCIWNMQVELKGSFEQDVFYKINKILREIDPESFKVTKISNIRFIYKVYTINLEVVLDDDCLRFDIHDLQVSYRTSRKLIDQKLADIFEKIQYVAKADSGRFGVIITFEKYNPYFGFFVRRLNAEDLQNYNIHFRVNNDNVKITKKSIEINAQSINTLNKLTKSYLALSDLR